MMNHKEIIALASNNAVTDSRQMKIASDVLKILSDNNTTVSEATQILNVVDSMISRARIDLACVPAPQDEQA